jgi:hypothetical protein
LPNEAQPIQYEFIVTDSALEKAGMNHDSSRLIHTHVMRHYIRQMKLLSDSETPSIRYSKPESQQGVIGKFKLSSWSQKDRKKNKSLEQAQLQPVKTSLQRIEGNVLPINLQPHTRRLLFHCKYVSLELSRTA